MITSVPFSTNNLTNVTSRLNLDIYIPELPPDPYWVGYVQAYLECPSANLYKADEVSNVRGRGGEGWAVVVSEDNSIYIAGRYGGLLDMDPGPGEFHTQRGGPSPFLIKLNSDGAFVWGIEGRSRGDVMNISIHDDRLYISGAFFQADTMSRTVRLPLAI